MQYFSSTSAIPSGLSNVAPTGQTCVHGDFAQWLHIFGTKNVLKISSSGIFCVKPSIPPFGETTFISPSLLMVYCSTHDPVSYTHLRAHETDSYLVCRLLL